MASNKFGYAVSLPLEGSAKITCEIGPQVTAPIWALSGIENGHEQRNLVLR